MNFWSDGKAEAKISSIVDFLMGTSLAIYAHWSSILNCWKFCDSWFKKVERILGLLAFLFGFSKPSLLVFKVFKHLLSSVRLSLYYYLPISEENIQVAASFGSQLGLQKIWDYAEEYSTCIKKYDCDDNVGICLMNIKIYVCNKELPDDDWEFDYNSASNCEIIMNESPLIFLGVLGVGLYILSYLTIDGENEAGPDVVNVSRPTNSNDSSQQPDNTPNPDDNTVPDNPEPPKPDDSTSDLRVQILQAICPKCYKYFQLMYPRPTELFCPNCYPPKDAPTTITKSGANDTTTTNNVNNNDDIDKASSPSEVDDGEDALKAKITQQVRLRLNNELKSLAKGVCPRCQDRLQTLMDCVNGTCSGDQPATTNSLPNVCPNCGHQHSN